MNTPLTLDMQKEIIQYISLGYMFNCRGPAGSISSLDRKRGKRKNVRYRSFVKEVQKAKVIAEKRKDQMVHLPLDFYKKNGLSGPT